MKNETIEYLNKQQAKNNIFLIGIVIFMVLIFVMNVFYQVTTKPPVRSEQENKTLSEGIAIVLDSIEKIQQETSAKDKIILDYESGLDYIFYSYHEDNIELTYYQKMDDIIRRVKTINFFNDRTIE